MSAITLTLLHILQKGDHILAHPVLYGGTFDFINRCLPRFGIQVTLTDLTNPDEVKKHIKPNTKLVYFETPTNPTMEVLDVKTIVEIAKKNNSLTMVDATFAPRPMQDNAGMGVDIICHSLTKYMGGHSDLIAGAVLGSKEFIKDVRKNSMTVYGPTLSPFAAYLVMRGITTLDLRIQQINKNAAIIAEYLHNHPKIERVYYPSIPTHPQYELAKIQMPGGYGAVMSFEVKGGYESAKNLADSIKIFSLAVSLGGVESLIQHPASMTHSKLTEEERKKTGIKSALIRISVGIEDVTDLQQALEEALHNA
jgi:methionine-gamma-lyase